MLSEFVLVFICIQVMLDEYHRFNIVIIVLNGWALQFECFMLYANFW